MLTAANNMDTVIKDLSNILEISNSSTRGLTKEIIDIAELLEQIQIDLKNTINKSSALIVMPDKGCFIQTNKAYLYSILYNLVNNAIKYGADRPPEIHITCQCHNNQIGFTVTDNGMGIDMVKHSESIFKPYHRINSNVEGKGLGLFLVKSHVEALGGGIEVESELGKGTTFRFILPS
jgi:signal transduction histidine kinase